MTANYAIWALVAPSRWLLWLTIIAVALMLFRWVPAHYGRFVLVALLAAWLSMGLSPLGLWLTRPLEQRSPASQALPPVSDIVVLAGAELLGESRRTGRLEVGEAGERVMEGAALAHRYPDAALWIVGGVRRTTDEPTDADWTASQWRRLGVRSERIRIVDGTMNTCENAVGLRRRGIQDRFLLVTSAYHMPRTMGCMRRQGFKPRPWPVDYRGVSPAIFDPLARAQLVDLAVHEYLGLLVYRLNGRIDRAWPDNNSVID